jgi:hypothetical protein
MAGNPDLLVIGAGTLGNICEPFLKNICLADHDLPAEID